MAGLERFIEAQELHYAQALQEIKEGCKRSHWMWFVFPQLKGLGYSPTARYFAIEDREEAEKYVQHPLLGSRLLEISNELLKIESDDAAEVFGYPDDVKLHSSMTLFWLVSGNEVFKQVLDKYFDGKLCEFTEKHLS